MALPMQTDRATSDGPHLMQFSRFVLKLAKTRNCCHYHNGGAALRGSRS